MAWGFCHEIEWRTAMKVGMPRPSGQGRACGSGLNFCKTGRERFRMSTTGRARRHSFGASRSRDCCLRFCRFARSASARRWRCSPCRRRAASPTAGPAAASGFALSSVIRSSTSHPGTSLAWPPPTVSPAPRPACKHGKSAWRAGEASLAPRRPLWHGPRRFEATTGAPRRCRSSVVEHPLGKGEVHSSILCGSTSLLIEIVGRFGEVLLGRSNAAPGMPRKPPPFDNFRHRNDGARRRILEPQSRLDIH